MGSPPRIKVASVAPIQSRGWTRLDSCGARASFHQADTGTRRSRKFVRGAASYGRWVAGRMRRNVRVTQIRGLSDRQAKEVRPGLRIPGWQMNVVDGPVRVENEGRQRRGGGLRVLVSKSFGRASGWKSDGGHGTESTSENSRFKFRGVSWGGTSAPGSSAHGGRVAEVGQSAARTYLVLPRVG